MRVRAGEERSCAVKEKSIHTARIAKATIQDETTSPRKTSSKVATKAGVKVNAKTVEELQQQWRQAIATNPSTPIPYSMTTELALAQLIEHPSFGTGMIIAIYPPDKADILFEEGIKSLRCQCK